MARSPPASSRMFGTGKTKPEGNVMHRKTRKNLLNLATGVAVAAAALPVFAHAAVDFFRWYREDSIHAPGRKRAPVRNSMLL